MTRIDTRSEEVRDILNAVRRVNRDVLEPTERMLDALPSDSSPHADEAYGKAMGSAREIGLDRLSVPEEFGGLGATLGVTLLAVEQLANGAPGFASTLLAEGLVLAAVADCLKGGRGTASPSELLGGIDPVDARLSVAVVGSDPEPRSMLLPRSGLRFRSRRPIGAGSTGEIGHEGSALRLRDLRLPIGGAERCTHLVLVIEPTGDDEWPSLFLVPVGDDVTVGPPSARMGLRVDARADVTIRDLHLTDREFVADGREAASFLEFLVGGAAAGSAARAVGVASRAHDLSFEYCQTRVQGGKPIIQHQSVAEVLWRTRTMVEAARHAVHGVAAGADDSGVDLAGALAARGAAARTVTAATIEMTELLGGYGVTTEYPLEKLYRDAQALVATTARIEGEGVFAPVSLF